jgi:hypothetical protein
MQHFILLLRTLSSVISTQFPNLYCMYICYMHEFMRYMFCT